MIEKETTATYRIVVYPVVPGEIVFPDESPIQSEWYELDTAGRKWVVDNILLCVSGRDVLSFDTETGGNAVFPHRVLEQCVVKLEKQEEPR